MPMIGCRPLSDDELADVVAVLNGEWGNRNKALVILGVTTGFRISELLSLKIRDVTINGKLNSHVRIPKSRMKGKRQPRSAVMAPMVRPYLSAWLEDLRAVKLDGGNSWLFQSRKARGPLSRIQAHRIITDAFKMTGLSGARGELATHTLRKTFADRMWHALDQNIFKVQKALGHSNPGSTVAYLSFNDQEQVDAVESVFPA